jgi:hypothetical protein
MIRHGYVATLLLGCSGILPAQNASSQPQLRAPWIGTKHITQGNHGSVSHNVCGQRTLEPNNCNWENTFAIDIDLNYETVLAAADGQVTYASDNINPTGGRQMAITHSGSDGNQYTTVYMHLSQILVYSGTVTQGQPIAISGSSSGGSETGTSHHLHFHMWAGFASRDSHTIAMEALHLKRSGVDTGYRLYDARNGDLDDSRVAGATFESNCNCAGGSSIGYPVGGGIPTHPSGTLVKVASSGTVFLLRGPDSSTPSVYRSGIANLAALHNPFNQSYAGDQLVQGNIITIADDEMNQYPINGIFSSAKQLSGNGLTVPDGLLIIDPGSGEISIISAGRRRPFTASDIFVGLGYKYCNVLLDARYKSYPIGDPVGTSRGSSSGTEIIQNGGFENGTVNWSTPDWGSNPPPWLIATNVHSGNTSLCLGNSLSTSEASGISSIYQWVNIPGDIGSVSLSFWYFPWTSDSSTSYDGQEVRIYDNQGNLASTPMKVLDGSGTWKQKEIDLSSYQGQRIAVLFDVYQDGAGDPTGMCIDDVSIHPGGGGGPSGPNVQISFRPNPVSRSNDGKWYYTVVLQETSGISVNLTGMMIGGTDYSDKIGTWFGSAQLAANGQLSVDIVSSGGNGGLLTWTFSGNGLSWSQDVNLLP